MSFYQQLIEQTQAEREYLLSAPLIQRCLKQQSFTLAEYQAFLTEAYHHVKHTVPLLMAVGSRLSSAQEYYRVAIAEYIEEELGHQEWVLNDIAATGADKEQVRHGTPRLATELMVAYAYDTVLRGNPLAFFGMVLVLEGTSVNLATGAAEIIQQQLQLPNKAFSYLRSHGSLDIEHLSFFEKLMDTISDAADQQAIVHAAKVFYQLYGNIFRSIEAAPAAKVAA
ncbi:long-chain fatty acid--CoA ligase [Alishewanella sp. WH16-1]|uniref:TenA family transcriptional regulator n=1 Tax=Alishewanella sp. WH16-1 TaxID=1651088 RepID=UPI000709C7D8|nr:iron-containing redox enzyme family protein [Alishewanella sp. WH16-1]KRS20553.1 long-chain fatty acid--CoA ligase [Alishewanella sp. WH16-1]